jgi:hypothetical protein
VILLPDSDTEKNADDYIIVTDALRKLKEARKETVRREVTGDASKSEQTQK